MIDFSTLRRALFAGLLALLLCGNANATPARCSTGYADSSCVTAISHAYEPAPTCSTTPGWTTIAPAQWQGTHWSAASCNFTAQPTCSTDPGWTTSAAAVWNGATWSNPQCVFVSAPTCPSGQTTLAGASWNGSSWVGLSCQAVASTPVATIGVAEVYCGIYDVVDPPTMAQTMGYEFVYSVGALIVNDPVNGQMIYTGFPFPGGPAPGLAMMGLYTLPANWQSMSVSQLEGLYPFQIVYQIAGAQGVLATPNNGIPVVPPGAATCTSL